MSNCPTSAKNLLDLPQEIICNILNDLNNADLKRIRSTCKLLNHLTPGRLFQSITLFPHARFLESLISILKESPFMCESIRRIEYELRWLAAIDFLEIHMPENWLGTFGAADRILELRDQILEDAFMPNEDVIIEFTLLRGIIEQLPCLHLVSIREAEFCYEYFIEPFGPQPYCQMDVLLKNTGHLPGGLIDVWLEVLRYYRYCHPSSGRSETMLLAVSAARRPVQLRCLCFGMDNILGKSSFAKSSAIIDQALGNIRILILTFTSKHPHRDRLSDITTSNLGYMLKSMSALEQLSISLTPLWRLERAYDLDSVGQAHSVFGKLVPSWNGIEKIFASNNVQVLAFTDLFCFEDELYSLLGQVSHSLRSLDLTNLHLLPRAVGGPKPCLVRALRYISKMSLKWFDIYGLWQNMGEQNWLINYHFPHKRDYFIERVQTFVTKGGECPLDSEAVPEGRLDVEKRELEMYVYDNTWRVCSREVAWDEEERELARSCFIEEEEHELARLNFHEEEDDNLEEDIVQVEDEWENFVPGTEDRNQLEDQFIEDVELTEITRSFERLQI